MEINEKYRLSQVRINSYRKELKERMTENEEIANNNI